MQKRKSINYGKIRQKVSKLFYGVMLKKITVNQALLKFPKDCEDKTIIASWHALCHLEADEDIRAKDKMYAEEQDNYIEFIAHTLEKGEALPANVIKSYLPYHQDALTPSSSKLKGIIHELMRFLCC